MTDQSKEEALRQRLDAASRAAVERGRAGWLTVADGERLLRAMGIDPDDIWRGLDAGENPAELGKRLRAEAGVENVIAFPRAPGLSEGEEAS